MSTIYCKLCSVILHQYFGINVQKVADSLLSSQSRTISTIASSTGLRRSEVILVLGVLIKFRLVICQPSPINENISEYVLRQRDVPYLLRYSGYVHLILTKYGHVGSAIIEEIIRSGIQTPNAIIFKCFSSNENKDKLATYRDTFMNMVDAHYLMKVIPGKPDNAIPAQDLFSLSPLNLDQIKDVKNTSAGYWHLNYQRFHQDMRDSIITNAVDRKLGVNAGECFKYMMQIMYEKSDEWFVGHSNPMSFGEVKHKAEKNSKNVDLIKYLDQYVTLIADDSVGFLRRVAGDQYVIDMKKGFESLASCCIEYVANEKFGPKASRIYRVIKSKGLIEQDDIQKEAMIPAKDARFLTYKLFEEQFIQIKTVRKAGGGGSGPNKAFFLFYISESQVTKIILNTCYKALFNANVRTDHEKTENKRLIDKSQRLHSIVEAMKSRGESEEYISEILETLTPPEREVLENVKMRIKTLSASEQAIDETILLLHLYQHYHYENVKIF